MRSNNTGWHLPRTGKYITCKDLSDMVDVEINRFSRTAVKVSKVKTNSNLAPGSSAKMFPSVCSYLVPSITLDQCLRDSE